jgi:hypothetical protein
MAVNFGPSKRFILKFKINPEAFQAKEDQESF